MNPALPFALIIGIDEFGAKELASELSEKDMNVVGVGDYVNGLNEINNFELLVDLSEVEGKFNYVFDFKGDSDLWGADQFKGEKITFVSINDKKKAGRIKKEVSGLDLNWRLVEAYGVYGPRMDEDNFLAEAIKLAVINKNLILPNLKSKFRILAINDLVEAVLRASFLSGTERESFLVLGKEINSEEVAKVLVDEAKMTRYKVFQKEIEIEDEDDGRLGESLKKLRWEAKTSFKDGIVETLQYFFSREDEENRKKKSKSVVNNSFEKVDQEFVLENKAVEEKGKNKRNFEVVIEETPLASVEPLNTEQEIENFYKQKKVSLEIEKVKPVEKIVKTRPIEELLDEKSEDIDENFDKEEVVEDKKEDKKKRFQLNWKLISLFLVIFLALVVPINWVISTSLAASDIKTNLNLLKNKRYDQMDASVDRNLERIKGIDQHIDDWGLNKLGVMRNYQSILKVMEDVFKLEKEMVDLSRDADFISQGIFKDRQVDFENEFKKEKENLNNFQIQLGTVLARLNGDYSWLPSKWRVSLQEKSQELKKINEKIDLVSKSMDILPDFLGVGGKKREYLVLFQNESELRATGGFIGSYGILTFQGGKLLNFSVKDVYDADGQLKGHVEPPSEIKDYLGEANWWLRDANWNPDFVKAAGDIQWFLNEETKQKVDGVIGINLAVAKSILGVTGEVNVPNFDKKINKDNLYQEAETYSEKEFFPGSIQKASFLGNLGGQLFETIKDLKSEQQFNLVLTTIDLLEKNEIQLAFNDQIVASKTNQLGWDGSIYNGKCLKEDCFSDYLFIVDSNFGVNKSNFFLNREVEEAVDLSQNSVGRILKITYENTSKDSSFPGGDYKNYLRVYLPNDINLSQISLTDANNASLKKIYTSDEVKIRDVGGKKEIGFLATIPVLSKKVVEIRYSSSVDLASKNKFSYVNYIQRQSGFGDTGMVTLFTFPNGWQPTQVEPKAVITGGKLLFNQKLDRDIRMGVELEK